MKEKAKSGEKISILLLGKILAVVLIVLLCGISFGGLYVVNQNTTKNLIPDYKLGMDLYGSRNIVIKVSDESKNTENQDSENTEDTDSNEETKTENAEAENAETENENNDTNNNEEEKNSIETNSLENYLKTKKIVEKRLDYMKVSDYTISLNEENGTISLEIPEDSNADYIAQYCITPGKFAILDNSTSEELLNNSNVKEAKVGYYRETSGTTVYLTIQFNKEGTEKLSQISKEYVKSQDEKGNDTSKKVDMKLDDQTILSSYFDEEITNGMIQISLGTATDSETLQTYLQQASNIATFLNTESMPVKYEMEINRFVFANTNLDINMVMLIVCAVVAVIYAIVMIVKYKKSAILSVISLLGFMAALLLAIRLGNVELALSGICAVAIMSIIEAIIIAKMQKEYNNNDKDTLSKKMIELLKKTIIVLLPIVVISIVFAFSTYTMLSSVGMVMFWAEIIMAIYNILVLQILIFKKNK